MSWLDDLDGPSESELWAIEADAELAAAEVALVDAEAAFLAAPSMWAAADLLEAVGEVVDLRELVGCGRSRSVLWGPVVGSSRLFVGVRSLGSAAWVERAPRVVAVSASLAATARGFVLDDDVAAVGVGR